VALVGREEKLFTTAARQEVCPGRAEANPPALLYTASRLTAPEGLEVAAKVVNWHASGPNISIVMRRRRTLPCLWARRGGHA